MQDLIRVHVLVMNIAIVAMTMTAKAEPGERCMLRYSPVYCMLEARVSHWHNNCSSFLAIYDPESAFFQVFKREATSK
jgi:hypothetical protein